MLTLHRRKHLRVGALLAAATLALTACSSGESGAGGSVADGLDYSQVADYKPTPRDEIRDGGEITLALGELSDQQNYFQADRTAYTHTLWSMYNPVLFQMDPDGTYTPDPDYLTNVKDEVKDDKTIVVFDINEKATFNDGTPIDWTAFENTWKFNNGEMDGVVPAFVDSYQLIESVTRGSSDKQAVVTFKQVYPWWEGVFVDLLPPQVDTAEKYQEAYLKQLHPEWGAGPFTLENVDFNKGEVSFVRNDKWWGDPAKLERVTYRYMEDQASINAFRSGEIDATGVGSASRLKVAQDLGDQVDIRTGRAPSVSLITLNSQSPGLSEAAVRQAVFTAIDRHQLAEIRFQGLGFSEDPPGSLTMFSVQEGYEDNFSAAITYDPEKAKKLLEDAGWKEGPDGIREKDGQQLTFRYTNFSDDATFKAIAQAVQQMMKSIGINLTIDNRPSSDFSRVTQSYDFDLLPLGFTSSGPEGPSSFYQIWGSDSQLNRSRTGNKEFDEKILEMQKLPTQKEQIEKANELEKEAFTHYGLMPTMTAPSITAVKPGLVNFGPKFFGTVRLQDIGWIKE